MKIACSGTAIIQHRETGVVYEIPCDRLDWESDGMGEFPMGHKYEYRATVEHPELGTLTWSLIEYPDGAENYREHDIGEHVLLQNVVYHLEHPPEPPEGW
jgi:hypothetical protein